LLAPTNPADPSVKGFSSRAAAEPAPQHANAGRT